MTVENINVIDALCDQCAAIADLLMSADVDVYGKNVNTAGEMLLTMIIEIQNEANKAWEAEYNERKNRKDCS